MKNVFFVIMLGVVLTLGVVMVGCEKDGGCSGDGDCYFTTSSQPFKWCGDVGCSTATKDNSKCDC